MIVKTSFNKKKIINWSFLHPCKLKYENNKYEKNYKIDISFLLNINEQSFLKIMQVKI
jgi:hypothetical protein